METKIKNAIITSVSLTKEDHGLLTLLVRLDYGGSTQGFGNYQLYTPGGKDITGWFIWRLMETVGVSTLDKLVHCPVRAKAGWGQVYAIGHFMNDKWFDPAREIKELE